MADSDDAASRRKLETRLVRSGRGRDLAGPFVNPPVVHASTVLFETVDEMLSPTKRYSYGRRGTPTMEALELAVADMEGAAGAVICPSGLSAITTGLLSCLSAGDRLLMVDCVYHPARHFADTVLKRYGVETTYFDPAAGAGIAELFDERTKAVYLEAPGSLTFEMQDLPAIAEVAHARGAVVLFDNTWATPVYFNPIAAGADISIQAGTKYLGGHADIMLGTAAANDALWPDLKATHGTMGLCAGPDDMYLALRGLRTLPVRLARHRDSALKVAEWLRGRPEVDEVLHPGLRGAPGHELWKRDMTGSSGLFGLRLAGWSDDQVKAFIDGLSLFGIGASWGGFESLMIPAKPHHRLNMDELATKGPLVRLHIGLEDPDDLIADLEAGFSRVAKG